MDQFSTWNGPILTLKRVYKPERSKGRERWYHTLKWASSFYFRKSKQNKKCLYFPGRGGDKRTNAHKSVNKIKQAAGLPKSTRPLHSLRHTFASLAVSSGEIDLYTLQRLTTHKTFSSFKDMLIWQINGLSKVGMLQVMQLKMPWKRKNQML